MYGSPSSAIGLADLAEAIVRLDVHDAVDRRRIARLLGFDLPATSSAPANALIQQSDKQVPDTRQPEANLSRKPADDLSKARVLPVVQRVDWLRQWVPNVKGIAPLPPESPRAWRPPPPPPLLPPAKLRQIVCALGSTEGGAGAVDLRSLVGRLARVEAVCKVPRLPRPSLRKGVQLIIDVGVGMQPFIPDLVALREAFVRHLGASHVDLVKVDGGPWDVFSEGRALPDYRLPPPGCPVVVVSDLGCNTRPRGHIARDWVELAAALAPRGSRLCAVVPVHQRLLGAPLPAELRLVPWGPATTVGIVRRCLDGERLPVTPVAADPADVDLLKALLSPAVRVEPGLLRRMRLSIPGAQADMETAVWFADEVEDASPSGLRFSPQARQDLLTRLGAIPSEIRRQARACMARQHECMPPVLRAEEEANWELAENGPEAAARTFLPVLAAMAQDETRHRALSRWAAEAMDQRMPADLREEAGLGWMHAVVGIATASRAPSGDAAQRERVGLRITAHMLELGTLTPPAQEAVEVDRNWPKLQVLLGDRDLGWFDLAPGKYHPIPLDSDARALRQIKVMISSTRADLMQYREVVIKVLNDLQNTLREHLQIVIVGMEMEGQTADREYPLAISREWVDASDWVILIVGHHYGTISDEVDADSLSMTEWEYRHARATGKKIFAFLSGPMSSSNPYDGRGDVNNLATWTEMQDETQAVGLKRFRRELETRHVGLFRNAQDFERRLFSTLTRAVSDFSTDADETLVPGPLILRNSLGDEYRPRPAERGFMAGRRTNLRQIKVMISSTRADLMQYRRAAIAVLQELQSIFSERFQIVPIGLETAAQTGDGEYPVAKSKEWVDASDWVILIVGRHYGTITNEAGVNGLSVTEREYRHALATGKKIFVFLSGPNHSTDPYDGQGDDEPLSIWTMEQTEDQAAGLKAFRDTLAERVTALFRNARHFEKSLRLTLTRALLDLGPDLRDPALRALLSGLLDKSLKPCFRGVKQLYRCKEIHDAIHRLRLFAMEPLRVAVYDDRGTGRRRRGLLKATEAARTVMAEIVEKTRQLDDDDESQDLKRRIDQLGATLREFRVVDDHDEPVPIDEISEQLDECSSALEKAFAAANAAMTTRKDMFAKLHESMTQELERAGRGNLPAETVAQIDEEIKKTQINRDRLLGTLKDHNTWQAVHGEVVEATLSGKVAKQRRCIEREASRLEESIARIRAQAERDGEDISALEGEFATLAQAQAQAQAQRLALPEASPEDEQAEAWDIFCHAFDACFFEVDRRTLAVIGRLKARVDDLEASFRHAGVDRSGDA
jgi:hypothetical protein